MKLLLCAIAGYLLGSISVSILVTKYIFHADLRQQAAATPAQQMPRGSMGLAQAC